MIDIVTMTRENFNPRPPHGERLSRISSRISSSTFQSTLPAWGATRVPFLLSLQATHFNPRSPHGERRPVDPDMDSPPVFQSTLPAWGATSAFHLDVRINDISIHAPRMGSDKQTERSSSITYNFNPRSPHGERP